jgi:hypothetical protein
MGGGSIGGSKQTSSSQSTSDAYGYSGSQSQQLSRGSSQSATTQGIAFEDLFAKLYGGASTAAEGAIANAGELGGAARQLFTGGTGFLEQLGGGADTQYLESRLGENPQLQEQIGQLGTDIGDFFRTQVNPTITGNAVAAGALGGGRQGVAQGAAANAAAKQFASGASQLRAADLASRDAAAATLGTSRISAATGALSQLPGLFGIAQGGANAPLSPYAALASILGGPTVLSQSQATSEDIAQALSSAFSEDFSKSQATSKGKGVSFDTSGYYGIGGGK